MSYYARRPVQRQVEGASSARALNLTDPPQDRLSINPGRPKREEKEEGSEEEHPLTKQRDIGPSCPKRDGHGRS